MALSAYCQPHCLNIGRYVCSFINQLTLLLKDYSKTAC